MGVYTCHLDACFPQVLQGTKTGSTAEAWGSNGHRIAWKRQLLVPEDSQEALSSEKRSSSTSACNRILRGLVHSCAGSGAGGCVAGLLWLLGETEGTR